MYKNMNDYEIIYMVSEDKDSNFNLLYHKYTPLILKIVKDYKNYFKKFGYDISDLMQIGYITLYRASYLYNDYNNSMFYTYFLKSFHNAIINEIKMNLTLKKEVLNNALSYDLPVPNSNISYIDLIMDNKDVDITKYNNFVINFKNSMSFDLSCVFELYLNGYNLNEISILLKMEINIVKGYLKEIKKHALTYKYLFLY